MIVFKGYIFLCTNVSRKSENAYEMKSSYVMDEKTTNTH